MANGTTNIDNKLMTARLALVDKIVAETRGMRVRIPNVARVINDFDWNLFDEAVMRGEVRYDGEFVWKADTYQGNNLAVAMAVLHNSNVSVGTHNNPIMFLRIAVVSLLTVEEKLQLLVAYGVTKSPTGIIAALAEHIDHVYINSTPTEVMPVRYYVTQALGDMSPASTEIALKVAEVIGIRPDSHSDAATYAEYVAARTKFKSAEANFKKIIITKEPK